jgi:V8-like Glu-specific endopeptidase
MTSRITHKPWRGLSFLLASLLSGLLLSGLFGSLVMASAQVIVPATPQSPEPAASLQVKIVSSPAQNEENTPETGASIWTDELIRQAKPYPMPSAPSGLNLLPAAPDGPAGWAPALPPDGTESDFLAGPISRALAAPKDSTYINPNSYSLFPFSAVGRVFFIKGGLAYSCSASVIGDYAIWTAGHCVHPGNGDPNGWHTSWIFIPAYKDNLRPYGTWQADYMYTTDQWMNSADARYDYAVVIVKPLNSLTIRQTVGAPVSQPTSDCYGLSGAHIWR